MESLSPTHLRGERTLPREAMDKVRIEEKQVFCQQLRNEVNRTRARVNQLAEQIKRKSME